MNSHNQDLFPQAAIDAAPESQSQTVPLCFTESESAGVKHAPLPREQSVEAERRISKSIRSKRKKAQAAKVIVSRPKRPSASARAIIATEPGHERLLRRPEVQRMTGLSRSSLYRLVASNDFPAGIKVSTNIVAWLLSEVDAWVAQRIHEARLASSIRMKGE